MTTKSVFAVDTIYCQLFKLREKLTPDGTWTKHAHAKDKHGHTKDKYGTRIQATSSVAVCWCIGGARDAVIGVDNGFGYVFPLGRFLHKQAKAYGVEDLPHLNDSLCKKQTDALVFIDWCIAYREWELETGVAEPVK